jgi:phosphoribosyl 1,2-cyclic phosphate phosphodiesterase
MDLKEIDTVRLVSGFSFGFIEMPHGPVTSTGFRFEADGKAIVYATDFSEITPEMVDCFMDSDVLVVDCLRRRPHPTHAHLEMALDLARRTRAVRTVLTHMDKSMDYRSLCDEVPDGVTVGYDGLEVLA